MEKAVVIKKQFLEIIELIRKARENAIKSVNNELISLYWDVGSYVSEKIKRDEWGESVVTKLAVYIKNNNPELKGFSDKNLWRMKQFYETYRRDEKLSPLVRELSWTNNLLILSKTKSAEEREFYLNLSIKQNYSKRELERQIDSCFYERTMLSKKAPIIKRTDSDKEPVFKDTYVLDFLNLPEVFDEKDLRSSLIKNFKNFVLEFGKDFAFMGEEYKVQVGNKDFFIDLLFYHRELRCLVAFELKIDDFKPEHIGKLNFYLEALDRNVKKHYENPSVGIILCKNKEAEVVEYALSRNLSPALISEYKTKLIDKKLLQKKMHEFASLKN